MADGSCHIGELHVTEGDTAALGLEGSAPGVQIVEEDARTDGKNLLRHHVPKIDWRAWDEAQDLSDW